MDNWQRIYINTHTRTSVMYEVWSVCVCVELSGWTATIRLALSHIVSCLFWARITLKVQLVENHCHLHHCVEAVCEWTPGIHLLKLKFHACKMHIHRRRICYCVKQFSNLMFDFFYMHDYTGMLAYMSMYNVSCCFTSITVFISLSVYFLDMFIKGM